MHKKRVYFGNQNGRLGCDIGVWLSAFAVVIKTLPKTQSNKVLAADFSIEIIIFSSPLKSVLIDSQASNTNWIAMAAIVLSK
jgi:hypothetical protein